MTLCLALVVLTVCKDAFLEYLHHIQNMKVLRCTVGFVAAMLLSSIRPMEAHYLYECQPYSSGILFSLFCKPHTLLSALSAQGFRVVKENLWHGCFCFLYLTFSGQLVTNRMVNVNLTVLSMS